MERKPCEGGMGVQIYIVRYKEMENIDCRKPNYRSNLDWPQSHS